MDAAIAVRATEEGDLDPDFIMTTYCNIKGVPNVQYALDLEEDETIEILSEMGLEDFKGSKSDFVNIINLASLVDWDADKAREFNEDFIGNPNEYLQNLIKYVSGYDVGDYGYKQTDRYAYLSQFGDRAFIYIYLAYFYYANGIIEDMREMPIVDLYRLVVLTQPTIYEEYILHFLQDPQATLNYLQMVPKGDIITYFLRSIPQYESIIKGESGYTDKQILSVYGVSHYSDHNDLISKVLLLQNA